MAETFAERLARLCTKYQTPNPMTDDDTAVFYYPEAGVIQLEGEFTAWQLQALCEAMQQPPR